MLVEWLGPEGARAGLEAGSPNVGELREVAEAKGVHLPAKAKRSVIVGHLVRIADQRINKTMDEMLAMTTDELLQYFDRARPSKLELMGILEKLDFHPGSEAQKSLYRYAARQISETGMFQRVAKPNLL